jgi:hypothetical protein
LKKGKNAGKDCGRELEVDEIKRKREREREREKVIIN